MSVDSLVTGSRLFLRHPTAADAEEFLQVRRRSRELHAPWEPMPESGIDPLSHQAFLLMLAAANTPQNQLHLACRLDDGAIVAYVALSQIFMGAFCSAYLGYWTDVLQVRRGHATEAVRLCLERGFRQLGLHRIEANIIPENVASARVVAGCGFRKEGYSPRYLKIAGRWQGHERWAITVEDWQQSATSPGPGTGEE